MKVDTLLKQRNWNKKKIVKEKYNNVILSRNQKVKNMLKKLQWIIQIIQ